MVSLVNEKLLNVIKSFSTFGEKAFVPVTINLVLKYTDFFKNTFYFLVFPFLSTKMNTIASCVCTYLLGNLFLNLEQIAV